MGDFQTVFQSALIGSKTFFSLGHPQQKVFRGQNFQVWVRTENQMMGGGRTIFMRLIGLLFCLVFRLSLSYLYFVKKAQV